MNRVYLTKNGYEKIRTELIRLQTKERPHVIEAIKKAREFGDLSENAEYPRSQRATGISRKENCRIAGKTHELGNYRRKPNPQRQSLFGCNG